MLDFAKQLKLRRMVIDDLKSQGAGPLEARRAMKNAEAAKAEEIAAASGFDQADCEGGIYGEAFLNKAMTVAAAAVGVAIPVGVVGGPIWDKIVWLFTTDEGLAVLMKIAELIMSLAILFI